MKDDFITYDREIVRECIFYEELDGNSGCLETGDLCVLIHGSHKSNSSKEELGIIKPGKGKHLIACDVVVAYCEYDFNEWWNIIVNNPTLIIEDEFVSMLHKLFYDKKHIWQPDILILNSLHD